MPKFIGCVTFKSKEFCEVEAATAKEAKRLLREQAEHHKWSNYDANGVISVDLFTGSAWNLEAWKLKHRPSNISISDAMRGVRQQRPNK